MATQKEWDQMIADLKKVIEEYDGNMIEMDERQLDFFEDMIGNIIDEVDEYHWSDMQDYFKEKYEE